MKKLLLGALLLLSMLSYGQNIQVHYDLGKDRKYLTSTIEMFKPDKIGNTFYFFDINYDSNDKNGINLAYLEFAREFKINNHLNFHLEYNGGLGKVKIGDNDISYQIYNSYLTGLDYTILSKDFKNNISFKVLYKNISNDPRPHNYQLTLVWNYYFLKDKLSFNGFFDYWRQTNMNGSHILLTEPQIFYNINKKLSIGSEIEFSNNFGNYNGFQCNPTIATKYIF